MEAFSGIVWVACVNGVSFDASSISYQHMENQKGWTIQGSTGLPDSWVILSRREEPPALILASRRSRRRRELSEPEG